MLSMIKGLAFANAAMVLGTSAHAQVPQQNQQLMETLGYTALSERLGTGIPTGQLVAVAQVEGKKDQYGPSQTNSEFSGKLFIPMAGPPGVSPHATTVGKNYYGLQSSMSFAVSTVYMWYPTQYILGFLKSSSVSTLLPETPPEGVRVFNHSWALDGGVNYNNLALRRSDWVMETHGILMIAGVVNPPKPFEPLMAGSFNGISVGLANGNHTPGPVPAPHDGTGRMKPELVAPSNLTSYATPIVGAAASLLFETADTLPRIVDDPDARRPEVIKAAMLAGTTHRTGWSNNPQESGRFRGITTTPLDPIFGADLLNVDRAHRILGAGTQPGASDPEGAQSVPRIGWERPQLLGGSSRFYRLEVPQLATYLSVVATWNRVVEVDFLNYSIADCDLHLWKVGDDDQLIAMTGEAGYAWFSSGNVVSASAVDNVEHLYVRDLEPGSYMIELRRVDDGPAASVALAWFRSSSAVEGDLDENGMIDGVDFGSLLAQWGSVMVDGDLNGDGLVDVVDMSKLLLNWFSW